MQDSNTRFLSARLSSRRAKSQPPHVQEKPNRSTQEIATWGSPGKSQMRFNSLQQVVQMVLPLTLAGLAALAPSSRGRINGPFFPRAELGTQSYAGALPFAQLRAQLALPIRRNDA